MLTDDSTCTSVGGASRIIRPSDVVGRLGTVGRGEGESELGCGGTAAVGEVAAARGAAALGFPVNLAAVSASAWVESARQLAQPSAHQRHRGRRG